MSNRILAVVAIVLAACPQSMSGQLASREADSLLQTVRGLDSVLLVRTRSVDSIRRTLVRQLPPVDIREGPIHVRTDSTLAPRVRSAVSSVVEMVDQRGGSLVSSRSSAHVATITRDSTRSIVGMLPTANLIGRVDAIVGSWDLGMKNQPVWTWPKGLRLSRFFSGVE